MAVATSASKFDGVPMAPPDPIMGVSEAFKKDTSSDRTQPGRGSLPARRSSSRMCSPVVTKVSCATALAFPFWRKANGGALLRGTLVAYTSSGPLVVPQRLPWELRPFRAAPRQPSDPSLPRLSLHTRRLRRS